MRAPISGQTRIQALQFSELPRYVFGERNALTQAALHRWPQFRWSCRGTQFQLATKESEMYSTKAVNGVPAIQRDGQSVLSVCDQDWDFANWLCALLNELGHMPGLLLTEHDREWLKAMDAGFRRKVQHA
jgi:hypothetical protein